MASEKKLRPAKKTVEPKSQKLKDSNIETNNMIKERQPHHTFKAVAPDED